MHCPPSNAGRDVQQSSLHPSLSKPVVYPDGAVAAGTYILASGIDLLLYRANSTGNALNALKLLHANVISHNLHVHDAVVNAVSHQGRRTIASDMIFLRAPF